MVDFAIGWVPADHCLPLVCHSQTQNLPNLEVSYLLLDLLESVSHCLLDIVDDLERIMFEVALTGGDLLVFEYVLGE